MPIYEYECCECRSRFEKKQRYFDDAVADCPKCQGKSKRVLSPVAVVFKGSGFYVTDYRKDKTSAGDEKPAGKPAEAEPAVKTAETKPPVKSAETKPPAKSD